MSVCAVRVVGYPSYAPPSSWWWVGPSWMGGWHDEVGWHGVEGRGVLVWWVAGKRKGGSVLTIPCVVTTPSVVLWCPLLFVRWASLWWWGGVCSGGRGMLSASSLRRGVRLFRCVVPVVVLCHVVVCDLWNGGDGDGCVE